MSDKFYPPQIEGTLPAFYGERKAGKMVYSITIPFGMNKTVSISLVEQMAIRIKTVQSNQLVYTGKTDAGDLSQVTFNIEANSAGFQRGYNNFAIGQYYKVQIAYVHNDEVGYYSTVGIIKCTAKPSISIANMKEGELHSNQTFYTGVYQNLGDSTEKLYSYYFNIYDNSNKLIATSGVLLHNSETDTAISESKDEYQLMFVLEDNKIYNMVYGGTTINGLEVQTVPYRIVEQSTIPPEIQADIVAEMNSDNGYVKINLIGKKNSETGLEENAIGTFQILRASEIGQYADWQIIHRFVMFGSPPSLLDIKDFTVEQGKKYKYALQQYNNSSGLVSNRMLSNEIMVEFEDCFLYDGKRQLKIKYNPKISSFKEILSEAKTNTLGGQYPFIFRNGKISYKEFPISGLVSYHMDEEHLFVKEEELGLDDSYLKFSRQNTLRLGISTQNTDYFQAMKDDKKYAEADALFGMYQQREVAGSQENLIANHHGASTSLIDYNCAAERIFKLKVLEFLNDGKPKLFRSATEGNYIVRLMNTSLAPNDQLGRMLHTFSTTATEVEEFSTSILEKLEIISTKEIDTRQMRWETVMIKDLVEYSADDEDWIKVNKLSAVSLQCLDMVPNTIVRITYKDSLEPVEISIGITGAYFSNLEKEIAKIEINKEVFQVSLQGQITYGFYGQTFNHFDTYAEFNINDIPLIQFIGDSPYTTASGQVKNKGIKEQLTDIRNVITNFNLLHFVKREVMPVYKFTSKLNGRDQTDYYTVVNIHNADIDYNNFTTNINLNEWQDNSNRDGDILTEIIKTEAQDNVELTPLQRENNQWLATVPEGPSRERYWYKYDWKEITGNKGITSLRCAIPYENKVQSLWIYYRTNLRTTGDFVEIQPSNQIVFMFDSKDEHIVDLRLYLPPLTQNSQGEYLQYRKGYLSYETYWEFNDIKEEDGEVLVTAQEQFKQIFKDSEVIENFDPLVIYKIVNSTIGNYNIYLDGKTQNFVTYSNNIQINNSYVDITDTEEYQVTIPKEIEEVYVPSGVIADIGVQRRTILYGIENNYNTEYDRIRKLKNIWLKYCILLSYLLYGPDMFPTYSKSKYPILESTTTGSKTNWYTSDKTFQQVAVQADKDLQALSLGSTDEDNRIEQLLQLKQQIVNQNGTIDMWLDSGKTNLNVERYNKLLNILTQGEKNSYNEYLLELDKKLKELAGEGNV